MAWLDLATEARAMRAAAAADLAPAVVAVDVEARSAADGLPTDALDAGLGAPTDRSDDDRAAVASVASARGRSARVSRSSGFASTYLRRWPRARRARRAPRRRSGQASSCGSAVTSTRAMRRRRSVTTTSALRTCSIDGAAARLIDFEYAGRGAPLLDLANLAGMNDFKEAQRRSCSTSTTVRRRRPRFAIWTMLFAWCGCSRIFGARCGAASRGRARACRARGEHRCNFETG